jgi:hypothetical protein
VSVSGISLAMACPIRAEKSRCTTHIKATREFTPFKCRRKWCQVGGNRNFKSAPPASGELPQSGVTQNRGSQSPWSPVVENAGFRAHDFADDREAGVSLPLNLHASACNVKS